jgi:hypothetical protein
LEVVVPLFRVLALLAMILLPAAVHGQLNASLRGTVRAEQGAPLGGVTLQFDGGPSVESDGSGHFVVRVPARTDGRLTLRRPGYAPVELSVRTGPPGSTTSVAVTMQPRVVLDALTVVARRERPLLNTEDATTGGAIEAAELRALPTDARDPLTLAFNIPGVAQSTGFFGDAPPLSINGANSITTPYLVDGLDNTEGFLGGPRVELPLGALSRLSVFANGYGALQGRSANGVVDLLTTAGTTRREGELFATWRPGRPFDARNRVPDGADPAALLAQQESFGRLQLGGSTSGAVRRDRTFYALAGEYTRETESRVASTALATFTGSELREKVKLFGRLDHGWSPTQTTTLRVAVSDVQRAGDGSGIVVPEADITTRRIGSITALTHRSSLRGGTGSHVVSLQYGTYRWYFPPTRSDFSRPQVTIVAPDGTPQAVVGSSNFIFDETERQWQLRDVLTLSMGERHTLSVGADVIRGAFQLAGSSTNPNGAYTVYNDGNITPRGNLLSYSDIPTNVRVRDYTIDANPQQVDLTQTVYGAFVEDRWKVRPNLLLITGLRWDYDDITSRGASSADLDNIQPRVSFNWYASPTTVLRGAVGRYAAKLPYAIYSDAVQFGPAGNAVVTFAEGTGFPPPNFGAGPRAEDLDALRGQLPPREIRETFSLGLEQPTAWQATVGWQRQFGAQWGVSLDLVLNDTRGLSRSWDLNPISRPLTVADSVDRSPAFGDPFRPVVPVQGSYRRLTTTESGGRSRFLGLYASVRRAFSDRWTLDANWVWSGAKNDTEDINFNATQANDFAAEYAWAVNDRRHKVTVRSLLAATPALSLALIADYQTGQPVNRVANFRDLDGSGAIFGNGFVGNHDRFAGVPRNGERLPDFFELSASADYHVPLRSGALSIRADVFNALNGTEWGNFANGIPGGGSRTQVGRPGDPILLKSPGRPRQVQFSARYAF